LVIGLDFFAPLGLGILSSTVVRASIEFPLFASRIQRLAFCWLVSLPGAGYVSRRTSDRVCHVVWTTALIRTSPGSRPEERADEPE
jgi:hypothetical protein